MASLAEIEAALVKADSLGNIEDARALANHIRILRKSMEPPPQAPNPTEDMGAGQLALAGAGKFFADRAKGVGGMFKDNKAEVDESRKYDAPLMRSLPGLLGNIGAGAATVAPIAAIPGANTYTGAALTGAAMGATDPVGTGDSRLMNTGMGALGGVAGQFGANMIGRIARPVQSELSPELSDLAKKAAAAGIPLDAAQLTGSKPLQTINSVMEVLPFTADKQAAIKDAQRQAYNRAILKNIGENADRATPEVLNNARTRMGSEFERLAARNTVGLSNDFLNSLAKIDSSVNAFTSPAVKSTVDKGLELAAKGTLSGADYQSIRSTLTKQASDAFASGNSELGQALKTIRGSLDDAASASISAADKDAWNLVRKQWGNLKAIEKAAAPVSADAVAGNVSPAKLAAAIMQGNKQGMIYGTGDQAMPDLARIGQAFIKDQVPNSGTAQRSFYQNLLTKPLDAAGQVISGAGGLVAKPVQAAINSSAGKAYLAQQPLTAQQKMLADMLRQGAVGGGATAGTALPLYQQ